MSLPSPSSPAGSARMAPGSPVINQPINDLGWAAATRAQRAKFCVLLFSAVLMQVLARRYTALSCPKALEEFGLLDEAAAQNENWQIFVILATVLRGGLVALNRTQRVWRDVRNTHRNPERAATQLAGRLIRQLPVTASLMGNTQEYSVALKSTKGILAIDAVYCIFSSIFLILNIFENTDKSIAGRALLIVAAVGLGAYDGKAYYSFNLEQDECAMVALWVILKNKIADLNIDKKKFRELFKWAVYVGATKGAGMYFLSNLIMQNFSAWASDRFGAEDFWNALGIFLAIGAGVSTAITYFLNRFQVGLEEIITEDGAPQAVAPQPILSRCDRASALMARLWGLIYLAASELPLTSVAYIYSIEQIKSTPRDNDPLVWSMFLSSLLLAVPMLIYTYRFSVASAEEFAKTRTLAT